MLFIGGVAAAAAVTAAFEAGETGAAAGEAAAETAGEAPDNGEDDEAAEDHGGYYWPFLRAVSDCWIKGLLGGSLTQYVSAMQLSHDESVVLILSACSTTSRPWRRLDAIAMSMRGILCFVYVHGRTSL